MAGRRPPAPLAAHGAGGISRRGVLQGAAAGALGLLGAGGLAGCSAPGAGSGLRYWNLFSGGDGALQIEMIEAVAEQLGNMDVRPVTLAWGPPYYTKLAMASAGGRSPELAIMHMSRLEGYAPGGLLDPWDLDLLAELDVSEDDFEPGIWETAQYDGALYALPLDTHPFICFYNTEVVDQVGLLGSDGLLTPIESGDDLLAAGQAMAEVTGDIGIAYGQVGDDAQGWRLFNSLYPQTGASLDLAGDTPEIDRDAAEEVVAFIQTMCDGTVTNPTSDYVGALNAFVSGRAGFFFSGEWELPSVAGAGFEFGGTPFPTVFSDAAGHGDSHAFVLPRQADRDPESTRRAHEFAVGMLKDSLRWAGAGHIPAYAPVVDSPEYDELTPQSEYAAAGDVVAFDPPAWFTGSGSTFQRQMSQTLQTAILNQGDPAATVDQMVEQMTVFTTTTNPAQEQS